MNSLNLSIIWPGGRDIYNLQFTNIKKSRDSILNFKFQILNSRKGFTLVEIVILLGIVGIVLSGVLAVYLNAITFNKDTSLYSMAYKIADSKLEVMRAGSFDSLTSFSQPVSQLPQGQLNVIVTNTIDGAPQNDIKKADITLRWFFKKQKEIRLVTLIARNGIVQ